MKELKGTLTTVDALKASLNTTFVEKCSVTTYNSIYEFPNRGNGETLYFSKEENASYRWDDEDSKYYCVGRNYDEIDTIICGGSA